MPLILETIVTTLSPEGGLHLVPFGLIREGEDYVLAPFRPSPTILNLDANPYFCASSPRDVRVIAGAVTGRRDWPLTACDRIPGRRLADSFGHAEFAVAAVEHDDARPRYRGRLVHAAAHAPFVGYNRAQAAVLEAAILSTRLHMLAPDKILGEMRYLAIAVSKTAGPREREAWDWIEDKVAAHLGTDEPILGKPDARMTDAAAQERETPMKFFALTTAAALTALAATTAQAHGPTRKKVEETVQINASPDKVWKVIGNFQDMSWLPPVEKTEGKEGNTPDKATRVLTLKGGATVEESLYKYSAEKMSYSYRITKVDVKTLPVNDYSSTLKVEPDGDGKSKVSWDGAFYRGYMNNDPPPELNDEASQKAVRGLYRTGLDALKAQVEKGS